MGKERALDNKYFTCNVYNMVLAISLYEYRNNEQLIHTLQN